MAFEPTQIAENVKRIRDEMEEAALRSGRKPEDVLLCAASKTQPAALVRQVAQLGIDLFGENRVQELAAKSDEHAYGGKAVHLIGHLQTNKVRQTVGRAAVIQSVDSLRLLDAIEAEARKQSIVQDVMIEINIAGEASKSGVSPDEADELFAHVGALSSVRVRGIMSIPPIELVRGRNRRYFSQLYQLFVDINDKKYDNVNMSFLSMGMSGDYVDAILEGANVVRIGSAIFGQRT